MAVKHQISIQGAGGFACQEDEFLLEAMKRAGCGHWPRQCPHRQ